MRFVANLCIALAWVTITGRFTPAGFLFGAFLGAIAIMIVDDRPLAYGKRILKAVWFTIAYTWDVIRSNAIIAIDVLLPRRRAAPAIVDVPCGHLDEHSRLILVGLVAMTPGTIPIDFSEETGVMRVHAYFGRDPARVQQDIHRYISRIREVWH